MNTNGPDKGDETLSKLLQEWRVEAPLPARFQESVWKRIEKAQPAERIRLQDVIVDWIGRLLPRPALAAAYLGILLAIGVTGGWMQARHENARVMNHLGDRYIQTLDPYAPGAS